MSTILVTGASGFLGSNLANYFVEQGYVVHALLRKSSNRDRLKGSKIQIDLLCDYDNPAQLVERISPDFIVHTACSYGRNNESPLEVFAINNLIGMQLIDGALKQKKPCTFINTGTVLNSEVNFYALSKNQFSELGQRIALTQRRQLRFIDIALQHMYGPGDSPTKFTTHVIHSCLRNEAALKLSAGTQKRDFVYIDDVLSAYGTLINKATELPVFERIELGSGVAPTVREYVELVKQLTRSSTELLFGEIPFRPGEEMLCISNNERLNQLGWMANYSLEQGLLATIKQEKL